MAVQQITLAAVCGDEFSILNDPETMAEWLLSRMMSGKTVSIRAFDHAQADYPANMRAWIAQQGFAQ